MRLRRRCGSGRLRDCRRGPRSSRWPDVRGVDGDQLEQYLRTRLELGLSATPVLGADSHWPRQLDRALQVHLHLLRGNLMGQQCGGQDFLPARLLRFVTVASTPAALPCVTTPLDAADVTATWATSAVATAAFATTALVAARPALPAATAPELL